jgi:hypothetical protein
MALFLRLSWTVYTIYHSHKMHLILGLISFLMHTSITIMVRRYHISQLQGLGLGYLEFLRMEWFSHSSMLEHCPLQVGILLF